MRASFPRYGTLGRNLGDFHSPARDGGGGGDGDAGAGGDGGGGGGEGVGVGRRLVAAS